MSASRKKVFKGRVPLAPEGLIEADEALYDARLNRSAADQVTLESPFKRFGLSIILAIIFLAGAAALGRLIQLGVINGAFYSALAAGSRTSIDWTPAGRGLILDRFGKPLVRNEATSSLVVLPWLLPKTQSELNEAAKRIASLIGAETSSIITKLTAADLLSTRPVVIEDNLDEARTLFLREALADNALFRLQPTVRRVYADGPVFAHVLGYTGKASAEEVFRDPDPYLPIDIAGRTGLEFYYEDLLRGQHGQASFLVNAKGERAQAIASTDPIEGGTLASALDSDLQKAVYGALDKALKKTGRARGAAIAIEPNTGEVLSLVSLPSFDNNLVARDYEILAQDPAKPLFNRAIAGQYPSGSTIKPIVGLAALNEKVIEPFRQILALGSITVPSVFDPAVKYVFKDWKVHGLVDFTKAMAVSSNVYFYAIGGGFADIAGLGVERLVKYFELFGLGQRLGIDLPGESTGFVPTPAWKEAALSEQWYIGDTYHIAIGQGDISVTPLQVAAYTAAIANGGSLFKPRFVKEVVDKGEKRVLSPELIRKIDASDDAFKFTRAGMRRVITEGSARVLNVLPITAAGKTGTAQPGGDKDPHAWFTVFAPYEKPTIVLTVIIENGGEGSAAAVPVAEEILRWYAANRL